MTLQPLASMYNITGTTANNINMEQDQKFLEELIRALVDNPDSVKVTRKVDEMGVLLTLDIHKDDMGKIIGRSGNTAKAIRTLLRVVGMKNDARVNLKINEPEGGKLYGISREDMNAANSDAGVTRPQLGARLGRLEADPDRRETRLEETLVYLEEQGYLGQNGGRYAFLSFLLRDYWKANHG